jgi:ABC-type dipeptide/oligopeptide/nickel transport system permease component
MVKFIGKRLLYILLVLVGISFLSFVLANMAPIDPAEAYAKRLSKAVSEETIRSTREELGFDRSVPEQYVRWLGSVLFLDFGNSYVSRQPVIKELAEALPTTMILALTASAMILLFSVPLGLLSAAREGGAADCIICGVSFVSVSIPGYFLGILLLLLFGIKMGILPVIGHGHPLSMFLASVVLAFPMIGVLTRIIRSLILENDGKDFVLYARARGISEKNILFRHLLRNAAPPCLTLFGQNIGYLIAGTVIVETVFSCPGLGQYALNAAINRDFPVINAYIVVTAVFFVVCNLAAEAGGMLLNPQLKGGGND